MPESTSRTCPKAVVLALFALNLFACGLSAQRNLGMEVDVAVALPGTPRLPGASHGVTSLEAAQRVVREKIAAGLSSDVTVAVRGGTYFLSAPLRFDDRDGGERTHRVVYKAAPGETVTIYGGRPLVGWEPWRGGIYRTRVPVGTRFYRLFENERSAVMARTPDKGSGYGGGARTVNNTTIAIPEEWQDYDFDDAQLFGWLGPNWFSEMRKVAAVDRAKCTLTVTPGSGTQGLGGRIYLRGVLEFLDEPGEWYLDSSEGYVYYWPRNTPIDDQLIVMPMMERVLDIRGGDMEHPVQNLTFQGFTLIGSDFSETWRLFRRSEGEASMPEDLCEGLVRMENARNVEVRECRILHAGHSGVFINGWAQECRVYGCWIEGAGFAGVYMNGWAPGAGPFQSAAESYVNKGHRVSNNYIFDSGQFVGHGCGIQFYQSGHNEISHNRIVRAPRYGISYKGVRHGVLPEECYGIKVTFRNHFQFQHTRDNVIAFNDISNVCRDSFDYGAIEAWGVGRDNLWQNNAIHDVDQAVRWDGWAHALFPDDATNFHTVRDNIIYECKGGRATGGVMLKAVGQIFENNIVADCSIGRAASLTPYIEPADDIRFRRNILRGPFPMLYDVREETSDASMVPDQNTFTAMDQVDYNLIWPDHPDRTAYREHGWDVHSLAADPLFDTQRPEYDRHFTDYRLAADSPAFELGFEQIDVEAIGLREDFPFDRALIGRRDARDKIQAEDYDRMRLMRTIGGECVCRMETGAWSRYGSMDFGEPGVTTMAARLSMPAGSVVSLHLGRPDSDPVGRLVAQDGEAGWRVCRVEMDAIRGTHDLYLVFDCQGEPDANRLDWFRFE